MAQAHVLWESCHWKTLSRNWLEWVQGQYQGGSQYGLEARLVMGYRIPWWAREWCRVWGSNNQVPLCPVPLEGWQSHRLMHTCRQRTS